MPVCVSLSGVAKQPGDARQYHQSQWRLALLAILIFFAQPGRTVLMECFRFECRWHSAGFTGPFIIFLAPITAILLSVGAPKSLALLAACRLRDSPRWCK